LRLRDPADESFEFTIRINSCEKMHATDASDISFYLADRRSQQRRPNATSTPDAPSLPIVPTSQVLPSRIVETMESTASIGKSMNVLAPSGC